MIYRKPFIAFWANGRTKRDSQRGGNGLAAIARFSALASLSDNPHTHSFREAIIEKEGGDLEAGLQPKMETPPKGIVGNVHTLRVGRSVQAISMHLTKSYLAKSYKGAWMYADHFVPQLRHCWLRNINKHTLKPGAGAPGMGHSTIHQSGEWSIQMGTATQVRIGSPGAGHLCGKQLPGAKQPCRAPLDSLGRHVAWCARCAREIRHIRLRDFLVEYTKSTGAIATSEQAMLLPRDSQPAARETQAVYTADIHISEPNGTDIWIDVRIGMAKPDCSVPKELARMEQEKRREYGQGPSNPNSLFDGVVPVIFEQHGCPSPCATTFLHHILQRRVAKLEQGSHLTHGVAWMIAARGLFAPISCILLVAHHQMSQECSPIVQTPDPPKRANKHGPHHESLSHGLTLERTGITAQRRIRPRADPLTRTPERMRQGC